MTLHYTESLSRPLHISESSDYYFLDDVLDLLQGGHIQTGMDILVPNLYHIYVTTSTEEWRNIVQNVLLVHPIFELLMQDPLTHRSFNQPRGYAGDSKLLDMVYFPGQTDMSGTTEFGRALFKYTTATSLSRTLCKRMRYIADYIDSFTADRTQARIMSVASGHCREASYSAALKSRKLGCFKALDHDQRSLSVMDRDFAGLNLEPVNLDIKNLLKASNDLGKFDLIYSAGLYDYLSTRFAQKLTEQLYNMLAPGGRLLLINIASEYDEIGYLESYMNWSMIGRNKIETMELADNLNTGEKARIQLKEVDMLNSHYHLLEIERD